MDLHLHVHDFLEIPSKMVKKGGRRGAGMGGKGNDCPVCEKVGPKQIGEISICSCEIFFPCMLRDKENPLLFPYI